jgi:hypothetical protein
MDAPFDTDRALVGMVHLPPLPGAPRYGGDREAIRRRAVEDARALESGGIDAVLVENFGDAPFYPGRVPRNVVASMTRLAGEVARAVDLPVGVNLLRNDGESAVAVAAATGASFVRVNVHAGARVTDQGVVEGRAHETLRLRDRLDADVGILADHAVKHSAPLGAGETAPADLLERGLADGVVVSGPATGEAVDRDSLRAVAETCAGDDTPVVVGSGVAEDTVGEILDVADAAIVGTALKEGGETTNPVDSDRVRRLVDAAKS